MTAIKKLRSAMLERGIEALLVSDELNQRYLTGFAFSDGYLLVLPESAFLVTDFRYLEAAKKEADPAFTVVTPSPMLGFIREELKKAGVTTLYAEDESLSSARFKRIKDFFPMPVEGIGNLFTDLRATKEDFEIENFAKAQKLTDDAFAHILRVANENMTEIDVALELELYMRRNGAEKVSFDTIAVSGPQSALPHGVPRPVKLEKGFLTMDFGCIVNGYCSDMTRTVSIGKADAEMKKIYETVLKAQKAGIAALKPGVPCREIDRIARDIITEAGYGDAFGHSFGHGVGMFIHEEPRLSPVASQSLLVGHVVTAEPGIYIPGKYGCRIEDMLVITEAGYRDFTHSPKELIELF